MITVAEIIQSPVVHVLHILSKSHRVGQYSRKNLARSGCGLRLRSNTLLDVQRKARGTRHNIVRIIITVIVVGIILTVTVVTIVNILVLWLTQ